MKKLFALMGIGLLAFACSDDPKQQSEPPVPEPEVIPAAVQLEKSSVMLPNSGGTLEISVSTNQDVWDAVSSETWLKVDKTQTGLKLTAEAYQDGEGRSATVTVTAGEEDNTATAVLGVGQNGGSYILEVQVPAGSTFTLPICDEINASIDWGDGQTETFEAFVDNFTTLPPSHVYKAAGTYNIKVSGTCRGLYAMLGFTDEEKSYITRVVQWGNTGLTTMHYAFYMCPNLVSIPADTDGSFAEVTTFSNAFKSCTGLTGIPEGLFSHATKAEEFTNVFEECTSVTEIPDYLFKGCAAATRFVSAFSGMNITEVPENIFEGCVSVTKLSSLFWNCNKLRHIPENIFAHFPEAVDFGYIMRGCHSLQEIPENLFAKNTKLETVAGAFTYAYSLTSVPEKLFANNPSLSNLTYTFTDCTSIKEIPATLLDNNTIIESLQGTFRQCVSLTGESPYTMVNGKKVHLYERSDYPLQFTAPSAYEYCFEDCTGLTDYEVISASYPEWL